MPVTLDGQLPVSQTEAEQLWRAVQEECGPADDVVVVRVVDKHESRRLKRNYMHVDEPTNVLTFSYPLTSAHPAEHDIALCLEIANDEATQRRVGVKDYVAWLLVHSFLHATGLDHAVSAEAARQIQVLERQILKASGFIAYE